MGHIFFILWVSGSWKSTLIKNLKRVEILDIYTPLSYKTRPLREWEVDWVDYNYLSKEDFFAQVQAWEFLEYALVHDSDYYGTKFEDVIDNWIMQWYTVVKELDIYWLQELRKNKPELDEKYTTIFLDIPTNIINDRIKSRWAFMSSEELEKRLISANYEIKQLKKLADFTVDANQDPEDVLADVINIMIWTRFE